MTTSKPHEALSAPLAERVHYLTIVASMAAVDVVLSPEETAKLKQLCSELQLPEDETEKILAVSHRPTATVKRHLEGLKASQLRFALLTDCLALAHADGDYAKGEQREIHELARELEVTDDQLTVLEETVKALAAGAGAGHPPAEKLAERLAAVGVPVGLVAALSAVTISTAGVATGSAAIAVGLGMATGFGALLGIGAGTVMGVRWLHDHMKKPDAGAH